MLAISVNPQSVNPEILLSTLVCEEGGGVRWGGVGVDLLRGLKPVLVINSELVLAISVNPLSVNPEILLSTLVCEEGGWGGFGSLSLSGIPG